MKLKASSHSAASNCKCTSSQLCKCCIGCSAPDKVEIAVPVDVTLKVVTISIAADGPKDIKAFSKDFKEVYCAINEEIALEKFYEVKAKWEKLSFRYSKPERNWDVITPFFKFPEKIQKNILYYQYHRSSASSGIDINLPT